MNSLTPAPPFPATAPAAGAAGLAHVRAGAAWLVTGPMLNTRIRPRMKRPRNQIGSSLVPRPLSNGNSPPRSAGAAFSCGLHLRRNVTAQEGAPTTCGPRLPAGASGQGSTLASVPTGTGHLEFPAFESRFMERAER